ncbi:SDR family NAD(P)-dependent oxidoreductase [Paraburkholderia bannensis]|uniref:SDR family NAD(P)-dependent oxidoreductase n=1 Tax=Paraburkholderia bannensis TaxID=765414 RepID=UPI002ABD1B2C|nr:glucose 1-dehydrogenase [Paraburkholderia bannensis]
MDLGIKLKGRRVLITGASSGFGEHFSRLAARCGASVVVGARRVARLEALARELRELGAPDVTVLSLDVTDATSVSAGFDTIYASGAPLDVVVNNAGISGDGLAIDQPVERFDEVMAINLRGAWLVATEAARRWRDAARGGAIVNIASIQGERVATGLAAYSTSKAAVVHMTRSLALEWARYGIRVNAIEPGYVRTAMTDELWETDHGKAMIKRIPMRRLGAPEEIDGALLLLATDAGSWITGAALAVDGGHLVSSL